MHLPCCPVGGGYFGALSNSRHEGGPVVADEWENLRTLIRDMAEGYAATDPTQAFLYRREAFDFWHLEAPTDDYRLKVRRHEAELLKQLWTRRIQGQPP